MCFFLLKIGNLFYNIIGTKLVGDEVDEQNSISNKYSSWIFIT